MIRLRNMQFIDKRKSARVYHCKNFSKKPKLFKINCYGYKRDIIFKLDVKMPNGIQMLRQNQKNYVLKILNSRQGSFGLIRRQRYSEFVPQSHTVSGRILLILLSSIMERLCKEN